MKKGKKPRKPREPTLVDVVLRYVLSRGVACTCQMVFAGIGKEIPTAKLAQAGRQVVISYGSDPSGYRADALIRHGGLHMVRGALRALVRNGRLVRVRMGLYGLPGPRLAPGTSKTA